VINSKVRPIHKLVKAWVKAQSEEKSKDEIDEDDKKHTTTWTLLMPTRERHEDGSEQPMYVEFDVSEHPNGTVRLIGPLKRDWEFTAPLGMDCEWMEDFIDQVLTDHETDTLVEQIINWMIAVFGNKRVYLATLKKLSKELEEEHPYIS
jgi:hypothetical protein